MTFLRMRVMVVALAMLLAMVSASQAAVQSVTDLDDINFWVGTGSNKAAAVIDFNNGQSALVWGYQWDGVANNADMLMAIDAADDLLSLDLIVDPTFGAYLNGITYDGVTYTSNYATNQYWITWEGDAFDNLTPSAGLQDTPVVDGGWYAFTYLTTDANVWPPEHTFPTFIAASAPEAIITPVPEPASLSLLALGGVAMVAMRRRRA